MRRHQSSAASPIVVGAATVLVTILAVFLAYNANVGLPLVPTYDIDVELPDAGRLTAGNEVRMGGRRVGTVTGIEGRTARDGRVTARLLVKLEQTAGPLPVDTRSRVRPRSALGLKYLELTPGEARRTIPDGGALPLRQADPHVELDEVLNAFDLESRRDLRGAVKELSDGLAGRAPDVNAGFTELRPLVDRLVPVMRTLAAPGTDLEGLIEGLEGAGGTLAPVAPQLGGVVRGLATTLAAIDAAAPAVDATLARAPGTLATATRGLRTLRPVVDDAASMFVELRPGTRLLPSAARQLVGVAHRGTPVLRRAVRLGPDLEEALRAVDVVLRQPETPAVVRRLIPILDRVEPTLRHANPYQVRCNYLGIWTRNAAAVISEGDEWGTWFRFIPIYQPTEILQSAEPAPELHATPYGSADGECEVGNEPYLPGQRIENPPGRQSERTDDTAPPPGVPLTP
jgi:virulence factor Mce-like protein